jgi:RNA polymerase sigma-70 factor (ECF subfamily)
LDRLWARYLPRLKKWAHGRLTSRNRSEADTDDLIQDAFVRSLARLRAIEPRGPNTLFAYFKKIVLNQVRDYARKTSRRPTQDVLESDGYVDSGPSPLECAVGGELLDRYQRALARLSEDDQQLLVAIVELRMNDREIAELFEKPSVDAVRMLRARVLGRLGRAMEEEAKAPRVP